MALLEAKRATVSAKTAVVSVFIPGSYSITKPPITVDTSPKPLLIVSPTEQGTYPVILFFHGTALPNTSYTKVFEHISSHGFIVVAPQLYSMMPPMGNKEVNYAAEVTNWLPAPSGLQSNLPTSVEANLKKIAVVGHSRGGQTAFALALGYATNPKTCLPFSDVGSSNDNKIAIVGIDPVAGMSYFTQVNPNILSFDSFNLSSNIPIAVIGTGLGGKGMIFGMGACAPEGANHVEFFKRCKHARAHFVTTDYGHMDMLDDDWMSWAMSHMCKGGKGDKDLMRRCVGGILVAFLKDYFLGESEDFLKIVQDPSVAPAKLDSVEFIES